MREPRTERRSIGGVTGHVSGLSLDVKIGFRVLARHPAVTVLAGLAMAFAIAICTATFEFVSNVRHPTLPLDDGERLVAVRVLDGALARVRAAQVRDFVAWREQLASIRPLGAFRLTERNLVVPDGATGPIQVAEMTASGFRVARVQPLLGRFLVDQDEEPGSSPVVVIGHDVWQSRFHGDPQVVGRTVHLDGEVATVVGVMPSGFAFPLHHSLWVPLRPTPTGTATVFGRLAPGASAARAEAELATLWRRRPSAATSAAASDSAPLRPSVVPYARAFLDLTTASAYSINLAAGLFLAILCANVGLLLFVRAASREDELAVRSALGASRRRIVVQLVVEALVLAVLATVVGLGGAALAVRQGVRLYEAVDRQLPFWVSRDLSRQSIAYAFGLTGVCAVLAGLAPAISATASGLQARLRDAGVGGTTMRLGRLWSATVVVQVALVVAYVPIFIRLGLDTYHVQTTELGIDASAYVVARLGMQRVDPRALTDTTPNAVAAFQARYGQLEARLLAEPRIAGVTYVSALPGSEESGVRRVVTIGEGTPEHRQARAARIGVDPEFFATLGMRIVAGRGWHSGESHGESDAVIVNQSFVREVLGGRNPIGQRLRYAAARIVTDGTPLPSQRPEPRYEIVGVVSDVRLTLDPDRPGNAAIYHLVAPLPRTMSDLGAISLDYVMIRVVGDATPVVARMASIAASIAASVDPAIRLHDVESLEGIRRDLLLQYSSALQLAALAGGLAALLAISGVYAVLSLTVSRRTREIGIRLALGADRRAIVSGIFARVLAQVGIGVAAGAVLLVVFERLSRSRLIEGPLLAASVVLLLVAGVAACVIPIRRALRVQPTEAIMMGR